VSQFCVTYRCRSEVISAHSVGRLPVIFFELITFLRDGVERVVEYRPNVLVKDGVGVVCQVN
jgi:hypothetical protein